MIGSEVFSGWADYSAGAPPAFASIADYYGADALNEELAQIVTVNSFNAAYLWNPGNTAQNTISISETVNVYNHWSRNLLIPYIVAVTFALLEVVVSILSLFVNGRSHNTPKSFSAILCVTRDETYVKLWVRGPWVRGP